MPDGGRRADFTVRVQVFKYLLSDFFYFAWGCFASLSPAGI
jgi:hypothetical protein